MNASKREGLAARLLEESRAINEGLKQLELAQDPDSDVEMTDAAKEAYFRLEIERKNERIKELTETQNQLLAQVQEFEQENIQYITEINELKEKVDQLERKLAVLEDENSQLKNAAQMPLDISSPDLDVALLVKELKNYSQRYARGLTTHAITERAHEQMKDLKFYLENIAPVKRMKDGEIWNVAIWFLHAAFSSVKARPGFEEMVTELIDGSDSAEILLQFCALLLAHLNIDGWS